MVSYILNIAVLMVVGLVASQVDPVLGMVVFPIPMAVQLMRRRPYAALGVALCAAAVGFIALGSFTGALYYALMAATGFPLGAGIARHWTYGWTVTAVAGLAYVLIAGNILGSWEEWKVQMDRMYDTLIAGIQSGAPKEASPEDIAVLTENVRWMKGHVTQVGLGTLLWPFAAAACVVLTLATRWFRRTFGVEGVRGSFRTMRVSEWLVWAAIATAALCFAAHQWPAVVLSIAAWNTAVGLAIVYWLNGLSILVYALGVLKPHLFVYFAFMILLLSFGIHPALCFLGLFDTWGDFRGAVDRVVAARKRREKPGGEA